MSRVSAERDSNKPLHLCDDHLSGPRERDPEVESVINREQSNNLDKFSLSSSVTNGYNRNERIQ